MSAPSVPFVFVVALLLLPFVLPGCGRGFQGPVAAVAPKPADLPIHFGRTLGRECEATVDLDVHVAPNIADGSCRISRNLATSDGRAIDAESAAADNRGPAAFVAIFSNCTHRSVSIREVSMEVTGRRSDSAVYLPLADEIGPGGIARVPLSTRGVGELVVTFRVQDERGLREVRGRGRARLVETHIYE